MGPRSNVKSLVITGGTEDVVVGAQVGAQPVRLVQIAVGKNYNSMHKKHPPGRVLARCGYSVPPPALSGSGSAVIPTAEQSPQGNFSARFVQAPVNNLIVQAL